MQSYADFENVLELFIKVYLAENYEYYRKVAAKTATKFADLGMRIGTGRGFLLSFIRSTLLAIIFHTPITRILAPYFAMLKIPYNRLDEVLIEEDLIKYATKG